MPSPPRHPLIPFLLCALSGVLVCATGRASLGFNELGHSVIAKIAYDQLAPRQRAALQQVLQQHPHYAEYLARERPTGVAREEWAFLRAATWADWVRKRSRDRYHKGGWHYINYPYRPGQSTATLPSPLDQSRNIRERLPKAVAMVRGGANTNTLRLPNTLDAPAKQAVALTWLCHLIGDLHQPLHVIALIDEPRWPESSHGDQGGNLIAVVIQGRQPMKLHSYWDGALELPMSYDNVRATVASLATRPPVPPEQLAQLARQQNIETWVEESYRLAAKHAYLDGTLQLAPWREEYNAPEAVADPNVPVLPESVKSTVRMIYRQRLAIAGARLARQLRELFP